MEYVDGGIGNNNPIRLLMEEQSHIWPPGRKIGCIVSIGTGILKMKDVGNNYKSLFESLAEIATDTEKVAREFEEEMKHRHGAEQPIYFRFNVQHGLEDVGLEEWREMGRTYGVTREYLKRQWTQVDRCVSQLCRPKST